MEGEGDEGVRCEELISSSDLSRAINIQRTERGTAVASGLLTGVSKFIASVAASKG